MPVRVVLGDNGQQLIVIDTPHSGRNTRRRPKLLRQGEPVGHHVGDVGSRMHFRPSRTVAGREALALVEDGMIDGTVPQRYADGT